MGDGQVTGRSGSLALDTLGIGGRLEQQRDNTVRDSEAASLHSSSVEASPTRAVQRAPAPHAGETFRSGLLPRPAPQACQLQVLHPLQHPVRTPHPLQHPVRTPLRRRCQPLARLRRSPPLAGGKRAPARRTSSRPSMRWRWMWRWSLLRAPGVAMLGTAKARRSRQRAISGRERLRYREQGHRPQDLTVEFSSSGSRAEVQRRTRDECFPIRASLASDVIASDMIASCAQSETAERHTGTLRCTSWHASTSSTLRPARRASCLGEVGATSVSASGDTRSSTLPSRVARSSPVRTREEQLKRLNCSTHAFSLSGRHMNVSTGTWLQANSRPSASPGSRRRITAPQCSGSLDMNVAFSPAARGQLGCSAPLKIRRSSAVSWRSSPRTQA